MSVKTYNAVLQGTKVRVSEAGSGVSVVVFDVSPGASYAIAQGDTVSVIYKRGGVKTYTKSGTFQIMSGDCDP